MRLSIFSYFASIYSLLDCILDPKTPLFQDNAKKGLERGEPWIEGKIWERQNLMDLNQSGRLGIGVVRCYI